MLFIEVPDAAEAKRREPGGAAWVVLADPESTKFHIVRSVTGIESVR